MSRNHVGKKGFSQGRKKAAWVHRKHAGFFASLYPLNPVSHILSLNMHPYYSVHFWSMALLLFRPFLEYGSSIISSNS
jgi:hypothetical protein